jgi:DNA-binding CsgD family transcriptional regulator
MRFDVIHRLWQRLLSTGGDRNVLDSDSITESERRWGLMVAPAINDHERARQRLGELAGITAALDSALRFLPVPALVLADSGDILSANDAARQLVNGPYMPASMLTDAIHAVRTRQELEIQIETDDPRRRGARLRIVPAEVDPQTPGQGPHVVFLLSPESPPAIDGGKLSGRFKLTPRQTEVVARLASGMNNAEVARALSIDAETVKKHVAAAYEKMGVNNRASLVAAAYGARFGQP